VTTFGAGSTLTAAMLNNAFPTGWIKQTNESVNSGGSGTTLQGDDELNIPILASTNYKVDAHILAIEAAGNAIDMKIAWGMPSGCILDLAVVAPHTQWPAPVAGNLETEWAAWQNETAVLTGSKNFGTTNGVGGFSYHFRGTLRVGTTAGFFRLWWAQVNASASNLTVESGSSIVLTPFTG
jgi:hypothetical protein